MPGSPSSELGGTGEELESHGLWPILAPSPVSFGRENVLQILKNEVTAYKTPDFWLCCTNPEGLAIPGPHVLRVAWVGGGAELQLPPHLGVWVGDPWTDPRSSLYRWGD